MAHRGDPFAHTENTLDAFAAAVAAGADMIELDVRRTSDGFAAVVHDPTL
ncbi:MAG TPA: glycerophosphodiester phosphodiesterase family protein, partial [Casimicrobiaceae bacterium]|nr:glycerophosphodiester phosphodiesterase family protein [Casimicrobiaceae bacterium]